MVKKILIVDDDAKLRSLLVKYLNSYGFETLTLASGAGVQKTIQEERPDLVILDVMLGRENGLEILKEIRGRSRIPVIMLTAKGEETDRIVGLELGADDYLPKPFNPRELLARMNSVLRRSPSQPAENLSNDKETVLAVGGFRLNTQKQRLIIEGREIELSTTEYRMMKSLLTSPNRIFSRDELMNIARDKEFMAFDRSIDVHISNLRHKIALISEEMKKKIKTVWGTGYMLEIGE
ncbi:MAG: response regulator [Deltaproteobacteria bacterium]|jgi:two-component system, OmpR family, phosphate regulon response regulator OmpR|nr:response regulator [Deltaproteobacteria bacterium]MBT4269070.1 response regulator [Deltaproteobacteria bacterium]MBT4638112.1 response regulator [Deltaproteobacteria bacterium]MBT6500022.1 response regulator [Deltaproteobacteria bacterium]MBT6612555.1 response regulator [Deltaproteobacteria bacterium]